MFFFAPFLSDFAPISLHSSGREDNFSLDDLLSDVQEDKNCHTFTGGENMEPVTVADGWKLFEKTPILKVHGSVNDPSSIILSHGGYKRLLHETVGYKNFMLSLMATNTILYMGFSFNDECPPPPTPPLLTTGKR